MSLFLQLFDEKIEFNNMAMLQNWILGQKKDAETINGILAQRWSDNAEQWEAFIDDKESYVNFEDGYMRFDSLLLKYLTKNILLALDVGCGTGHVSRLIADNNAESSVDAFDIAPGMIKKAKEITRQRNIQFVEADIFSMKKLGGEYDLICSRGVVISHMPLIEVPDFLYYAASMLNDGGLLIFDFIQHLSAGNVEKPSLKKNEFSFNSIDRFLRKLGLENVCKDGGVNSRVIIACYKKKSKEIGCVN